MMTGTTMPWDIEAADRRCRNIIVDETGLGGPRCERPIGHRGTCAVYQPGPRHNTAELQAEIGRLTAERDEWKASSVRWQAEHHKIEQELGEALTAFKAYAATTVDVFEEWDYMSEYEKWTGI